jgi:hypothetical protein
MVFEYYYIAEKNLNAMSADDYNGVVRACFEYEESVRSGGKLIAAEALEPIHTATTVKAE